MKTSLWGSTAAHLARAEGLWQAQVGGEVMDEGATLLDPDTVYFSHDTILGTDGSWVKRRARPGCRGGE